MLVIVRRTFGTPVQRVRRRTKYSRFRIIVSEILKVWILSRCCFDGDIACHSLTANERITMLLVTGYHRLLAPKGSRATPASVAQQQTRSVSVFANHTYISGWVSTAWSAKNLAKQGWVGRRTLWLLLSGFHTGFQAVQWKLVRST